jgi:bifunctional oligoribonuclease and PAP phosphatase NrnA
MSESKFKPIESLIAKAQQIVVVQADNPDGDSLGSALALEQILSEAGKTVHLYCGVAMPQYLHHLGGWSRVSDMLPGQFDLSIIVDTSASSLLQKLNDSGQQGWVSSKPCIVLDHHAETENDIVYATVVLNDPTVSSTGELIYNLAKELGWPLDATAGQYIMTAILGDTQGLTNELASSETYRAMAELVDVGVNRPHLEELRREYSKMDPRIFRYKARLIERTELLADGKLAIVTIPQEEINSYSPLYNPAPLIQNDMLQTIGVGVALVFKTYDDGKVLGSVRCNSGAPIGADLAARMGGGGHQYAAGFKVQDGRPFNEIKSECIRIATELLQNLDKG